MAPEQTIEAAQTVLNLGGLLAGLVSVYQNQKGMDLSKDLHKDTVRVEKDHHAKEVKLAKQHHFEILQNNLFHRSELKKSNLLHIFDANCNISHIFRISLSICFRQAEKLIETCVSKFLREWVVCSSLPVSCSQRCARCYFRMVA